MLAMSSQPVNHTWDPREHRFVSIQAQEEEAAQQLPPVVLPLELRVESLAENVISKILKARTFGKPNEVVLPRLKEDEVKYWHAWKEYRPAAIFVRNIRPFLSSAVGDAPCTTGMYSIDVVFQEDVKPSQKADVKKVFADTFKVHADENQTFTPKRKGWIQLHTELELILHHPQRAGRKPACIFNLVVTVVSDKVAHPLSENEAARFEQVRWNNRASERRRVSDASVRDVSEVQSRIERMIRHGADRAQLQAQYVKALALSAQRDYLEHRAEVAERTAKKWMDIAYNDVATQTIKVASVEGFKMGALIEQTQKVIIIAVGDKSITVRHPNGEQQTLMLSTETQARPGMYAEGKKGATVMAVNSSNNELHITPWKTKK